MAIPDEVKEKITIVLIPGSHSTPVIYQPISKALSEEGFRTTGVHLLSACARDKQTWSPATLAEDASHIRGVLLSILAQGQDIVLVMCSYGGFPGTEALKNLVSRSTLARNSDDSAAIVGLLYLSSFMPWSGDSLQNLTEQPKLALGTYGDLGGATGPDLFSEWAKEGDARAKDIEYQFMHLCTQSADSMQGQLTHDLWPEGVFHGRILFLIGENDAVISSALREKMINKVNASRKDKVKVHQVDGAGHLMVVERSDAMVQAIKDLISSVVPPIA